MQHQPSKAQINPGLSLSLDEKRGSRQYLAVQTAWLSRGDKSRWKAFSIALWQFVKALAIILLVAIFSNRVLMRRNGASNHLYEI